MTHIASSLNATHGEFGASKSVRCAPTEGAPYPPLRMGHPQFTTRQILKIYALCAALGFGAMAIVHAKRTADLNANWEMINE